MFISAENHIGCTYFVSLHAIGTHENTFSCGEGIVEGQNTLLALLGNFLLHIHASSFCTFV